MGRDGSSRVYPESGVNLPFHPASHHGEREDRVTQFAKINKYHVGLVPYFLEKLKNTPDGDSNLLENTLVVYGSPMGNSNVHNHKRCPLFLAGHAGGSSRATCTSRRRTARRWPTRSSTLARWLGSRRHQDVRRQHRRDGSEPRAGDDGRVAGCGGRGRYVTRRPRSSADFSPAILGD